MKDIDVTKGICVWNYENLPETIKDFMEGENITKDDLDWIALVSPCYSDMWIDWLDGPSFGCCDVIGYKFKEDYKLVCGYHA